MVSQVESSQINERGMTLGLVFDCDETVAVHDAACWFVLLLIYLFVCVFCFVFVLV